jgi:hypothetical protein
MVAGSRTGRRLEQFMAIARVTMLEWSSILGAADSCAGRDA